MGKLKAFHSTASLYGSKRYPVLCQFNGLIPYVVRYAIVKGAMAAWPTPPHNAHSIVGGFVCQSPAKYAKQAEP